MGAVNYYTSDYITMGYDLSWDYCENDFNSFEEMCECRQLDIDESWFMVNELLEKQNFWYYHVVIKPGYYEGFTIDIENNFPVAFDNWEDRRYANKEVTRIKAFLMACCDLGMVQVWPGWCTSYETAAETKTAITAAIREMREEIKTIPTWTQYEKAV